jgi:hypothetical protein
MIATKKLKLIFKDDMRRINYDFTDFKRLSNDIAQIYQIKEEEYTLKYLDDEKDLVSICSDIELQEFLKCNSDSKLVKIHVVSKSKNKRIKDEEDDEMDEGGESVPQLFGRRARKAGKFLKHLRKYNLHQIIENLIQNNFCKVVQNYLCDSCNKQIVGNRYHCLSCEDFDFCSSCYLMSDHYPTHEFKEITAGVAFKDALKRFGVDIEIVKIFFFFLLKLSFF